MKGQNFSTASTVEQMPAEAFAAINNVRGWWSGDIEGATDALGEEFTYRYKDVHYSKQKITEFVPGRKVVWRIVDSHLSFVANKTEWNGTQVVFEIADEGGMTQVRFTPVGLAPEFECFEGCSTSWGFDVNASLRDYIASGKGQPNSAAA